MKQSWSAAMRIITLLLGLALGALPGLSEAQASVPVAGSRIRTITPFGQITTGKLQRYDRDSITVISDRTGLPVTMQIAELKDVQRSAGVTHRNRGVWIPLGIVGGALAGGYGLQAMSGHGGSKSRFGPNSREVGAFSGAVLGAIVGAFAGGSIASKEHWISIR